MAEIIFYATKNDFDLIRLWINSEPDVAWIVKTSESDLRYTWRAVSEIDEIIDGYTYAIWHIKSGALNVPSGSNDIPDAVVADPFKGWTQNLKHSNATKPWFGANLPGPFSIKFCDIGREAAGSLGRSGVHWLGDHFKSIDRPAENDTKKWWQKLKRFVSKNATEVLWVPTGRTKAFIFPDALAQINLGRQKDING